jgi:RluA family pseudouridine synthase
VPESLAPLVLLHEDHDLVAVAKPAGEPVIAARGEPRALCLQSRIESRLRRRVWVVHRIDRDASGVVLFALNADAHRELSLAFEHRQVTKSYTAFVTGSIEPPRGRIEVPLHAARRGRTRPALPDERGTQPSATEYVTRKRWTLGGPTISVLEARPLTGRHHQIRVHLRSVGTPILFDALYGRGLVPEVLANAPCGRLALHARKIDVPTPRGHGRVVVEAPLATDLVDLAAWLDAHGRGEVVGV